MEAKRYRLTSSAKIILIELIICIAGLFCGFAWGIKNEITKWDKLIYPGVKIEGMDLSGKGKEEAINLIKSNFVDPLLKSEINMNFNGKTYAIENSKLIKEYRINNVIDEVYKFGKSLPVYEKYVLIREGTQCDYRILVDFNDEYLKSYIKSLASQINKEPVDADIQISSDNRLTVSPDIKGFRVYEEKLETDIKDLILNNGYKNCNIDISAETINAAVTAEKLSSINSVISSFSTDFSTSSKERCQNVELAAKLINGKLLMPGDTFSFNDTVGERTSERAFAIAPVIVGNRVESGLGGGICQVSSTLYNAILYAGLKPTERVNHSLPSAYVGLGMDATVDWGTIDFKFQNTLQYPLLINATTIDKNLHINIYSDSSLTGKKYVITNDVYERVKANTKTIIESGIPEGQTIILSAGRDGFRVRVTRDTYENGALTNSEVISTDYYAPVDGFIKKGAK